MRRKPFSFDEQRDAGARLGPFGPARGLRVCDRPAAERVLRLVRNLGRAGVTPAEAAWLFELPEHLLAPVMEG